MYTQNEIQLANFPLNQQQEISFNAGTAKSLNEEKNKKSKRLPLYNPENIDLDKLLSENPPDFKYHKDYFVYIMSLIVSLPSKLKDFDIEKAHGFIPINKQILQKRIHEYRRYLDYLIYHGIIEEDRQYFVGQKSRGLRFTDNFQTKIKRVYIEQKKTLIKSIENIRKEKGCKDFCNNIISLPHYDLHYLQKWWNDQLRIDFIKAKQYLEEELHLDMVNPDIKFPIVRYNSRILVVNKLHHLDYLFRLDETAGRLHTLLTQLKTELRQFVTYGGQVLTNIDIVNSQPFLSTILLDDEKILSKNILDKISLYKPKYGKGGSDIQSTYSTMLVKFIQKNKNNADVKEYINYVVSGNFYEFFGEKLLESGFITESQNLRKEAKKIMFSSLFSPNEAIGYKNEMKIFRKLFPTVYHIFKLIKSGKGNHRTLACVLQNIEADVVLNNTCKAISEICPEMPLFTIHDSITTTEEYEEIGKEILKQKLTEYAGLEPKLDVKIWKF